MMHFTVLASNITSQRFNTKVLTDIESEPMVPMIGAYGLLSLGIYLLWEKTKKAVLFAREKELQHKLKVWV
jgi:hypothetical protein